MSVLVKGMEMPKDGTCIFIFASDENGQNTELAILRYASFELIKHKGVVALPPHGRLIDADSLIAKHEKAAHSHGGASYSFHMAARAWVMKAPTIIEAEEG